MGVYVPVAGSATAGIVLPGSAIVGEPADDRVLIHYEGNKYGAVNLATWEQRLLHAWARAVQRAPTVAKAAVPQSELIRVGYYDGERVEVHRREELDDWLEEAGELTPWVARFEEANQETGEVVERMVLVWATSAEDAQQRSGLVVEEFAPAAQSDEEEWEAVTEDAEMNVYVLGTAATVLRSRARAIGRSRARVRRRGHWVTRGSEGEAYDSERSAARRLMVAAALLDSMIEEAKDERGQAA